MKHFATIGGLFFLLLANKFGYSQVELLSAAFNNDIWNRTDRYYTTGIQLQYINQKLIPHKLLHTDTSDKEQVAAISLLHDVYTPSVYNTNTYNPFDRPYAGVLAAEYYYLTQKSKMNYQGSILVGLIGKAALGQEVQNGVHEIIENLDALGWRYQLKNGLLLNVAGKVSYTIWQGKSQQINAISKLNLGTYRTNLETGFCYQIGQGSFSIPTGILKLKGKWAQSFTAQSSLRLVGYDATLQGAWGQNYTYGLRDELINRFPILTKLSYTVRYMNFQLALEQNIQSPEFRGAVVHRWVGIKLTNYFR